MRAVSLESGSQHAIGAHGQWEVYYAEASCITDGACELCVADPNHGSQSSCLGLYSRGIYHCMPPWTTGTKRY